MRACPNLCIHLFVFQHFNEGNCGEGRRFCIMNMKPFIILHIKLEVTDG